MKVTPELKRAVYARSGGDCHICHDPVGPRSYGRLESPLGWEIDHSVPRSRGGTDRLNNLYPAHIDCNRSKGAKSTRTARRAFGYGAAPLSLAQRAEARQLALLVGVGGGGAIGYWLGQQMDISREAKWLLLIGCGVAGGLIAHQLYPR